ncbi:MAG TPA: NTP transferase domain-containing protein [Alphaproteobacteria bacterium]|nr:NTP transferase domain-containing protein [Alphaproteobacteria bacterium]
MSPLKAAHSPNLGFTALVLAGSRGAADPVALAAGLRHKALVPVAGRPMVLRVLDTLRQCPEVRRIVLCLEDVGIASSLPELAGALARGELMTVAADHSPAASVLAVLERLTDPLPLLVVTADHPLLTPAMIRHFLGELGDAQAAAAVAAESVIARAYPQTKRTYIRLKDGAYSGCNLFALTGADAAAAARFWMKVERYRKQPWRFFAAAGPWALLSFLLGRLDLTAAVERLSEMLEVRLHVVAMPFAEAAIDVDKPSDLALAEKIIAQRG